MADRFKNHGTRPPKHRIDPPKNRPHGYFFPGEAARILGFESAEYRLLRRLYRLVRLQRGEETPKAGWSRWTYTDLACVALVVDYCGGAARLELARRVTLGQLEVACLALRDQGYRNPLLEVRLHRVGRTFYAVVDGVVLDPVTGQLLLEARFSDAEAYLEGAGIQDKRLLRELRAEIKLHRNGRKVRQT